FHVIRAIVGQFANTRAQSLRTVADNLNFEWLEVQRIKVVARGCYGENRSGRKEPRPLHQSLVDRALQLDIGEPASMRSLNHLRRVSGPETLSRAVKGNQSLVLQSPGCIGEVNVTIDKAGEHRGFTEIDHRRAVRNRNFSGGTFRGDPLSLDKDGLVGQHFARGRIEQLTCPNCGCAPGLRREYARAHNKGNETDQEL